ncbi:MAG: SMP-30/gluconolactonase/LRE family protein [Paludibaculum sp.]
MFQGKVYGVALGKDDSGIWILNQTQLYQVDWRSGRILSNIAHNSTPAYQGLLTHEGSPYVAATVRRGNPGLFSLSGGQLRPLSANLGKHNAGGLGYGGGRIVLPITAQNRAVVVELPSGKTLGEAATGIAPFAAVVSADGRTAYVSNWARRIAKPGERTSPAGPGATADQVLVDDRGVTASGTVTRIDLSTLQATHSIPTGLHPNGLAWDETRSRLYVANNNDDSVTVIDTAANRAVRQIRIQPFAGVPSGLAPTAVTISADGKRLFVACGGINAIAVIDTMSGRLDGLIPTGWYPSGLALSADGKRLAVTSMLGVGSGFAEKPERRFVHSYRGTVHVLDLPDAPQLASYTRAVADNNHLPLTSAAAASTPPNRTPKAVPERAGDASLIEHIVYIIKENRTYDQVLGDMPKGNGDPSLVMFGEEVTPNTHRLADQFVLLDNFYASGGNSADGHQWLAQANEVSYALWPGYEGRSYPFDGTDPMAIGRGGTIWDMARKLGKTVRLYGEYGGTLPEPPKRRIEYLNRWKAGEDFTSAFNIKPPSAHLIPFFAANYPPYSNTIPDQIRSQIFLKDLKQWEQDGRMPNMTVMLINCDHTFGTTPETSTPKAMVANDQPGPGPDCRSSHKVEVLAEDRQSSSSRTMPRSDRSRRRPPHRSPRREPLHAPRPCRLHVLLPPEHAQDDGADARPPCPVSVRHDRQRDAAQLHQPGGPDALHACSAPAGSVRDESAAKGSARPAEVRRHRVREDALGGPRCSPQRQAEPDSVALHARLEHSVPRREDLIVRSLFCRYRRRRSIEAPPRFRRVQ